MLKFLLILSLTSLLSACEVARGLFGYIPPPEETTISEELQLEYDRCMKIGGEKNCAQAAYDVVRRVKGLEPRKVPKGVVIILEGSGGHETPAEQKEAEKNDNQP